MRDAATHKVTGPRGLWALGVSVEMIDITCEHDTLDDRWRGTDSNGHEHYYDHGWNTLRYVVDRSHWCDGHEGMYNHDPHEAVDADHYECLICNEVVRQGIISGGTPRVMPGRESATFDSVLSNGLRGSWDLTPDQLARLRTAMTAATTSDETTEIAIRFADELPLNEARQVASR